MDPYIGQLCIDKTHVWGVVISKVPNREGLEDLYNIHWLDGEITHGGTDFLDYQKERVKAVLAGHV